MKAEYKVISNSDGNDYERELNQEARNGFKVLECGYSRAVQIQQGGMFSDGSYYRPLYWAIMEKIQEDKL